jgi:hypothetical protein
LHQVRLVELRGRVIEQQARSDRVRREQLDLPDQQRGCEQLLLTARDTVLRRNDAVELNAEFRALRSDLRVPRS